MVATTEELRLIFTFKASKTIQPMIGVVICGGQSRRMGHDKGLLIKNNQTWAIIAAQKLQNLCNGVLISINQTQFSQYSELFTPDSLVLDNPRIPLQGPLLGLLSVHVQHPSQDLLIMACDMPDIDSCILKKLSDASKTHHQAICYIQSSGQIEPLLGIYKAQGLRHIWQTIQQTPPTKASMHWALSLLKTNYLPIPQNEEPYFKNYNHPSD